MHYVRDSLIQGEKILHIGRFHWTYFAGAIFWIIFGFMAAIGILWGALYIDIAETLRGAFPELPTHLKDQAWDEIVAQKGGYMRIIGGLHLFVKLGAFGAILLGFFLFIQMMLIRSTTEIAVTTSRLVLKEGIIARNVDEMSVDRVESVHVMQSMLGRLMGYGTVMVRGMGVGEIILPPIMDPIAMRKNIEKAKIINESPHTW